MTLFFLQPSLQRCQIHTHLSGDIHLKVFKMNILLQTSVRITVARAVLYLDISQQQDWQSQDVTIHLQAAGNQENLLTSYEIRRNQNHSP